MSQPDYRSQKARPASIPNPISSLSQRMICGCLIVRGKLQCLFLLDSIYYIILPLMSDMDRKDNAVKVVFFAIKVVVFITECKQCGTQINGERRYAI
jgi:hypothetical protein